MEYQYMNNGGAVKKYAVGLVGVIIFSTLNCAQVGNRSQRFGRSRADTDIPRELAARNLRIVRENYVLYYSQPASGTKLQTWLDEQLASLGQRYQLDVKFGVVLAIDGIKEPSDTLEEWRRTHVARARPIHWTHPRRQQAVTTLAGRPYCLQAKPYFIEAYHIPLSQAENAGIPEIRDVQPAWICVVPAVSHFERAVAARLRDDRAGAETGAEGVQNTIEEIPVESRVAASILRAVMSATGHSKAASARSAPNGAAALRRPS
jgi:hypothetical protein